jgi:hypothetical protein
MAASTPDPADMIVDRMIFDIKALGAQGGWGPATTMRLRERLLASHDEDIKGFLTALERTRPLRPWGQVLIGLGELVFGAFLTVIGLVLFIPAILGFSSSGSIARYLADLALGLSASGISDPVAVALGFAFALFLILAALYTLRQASVSLREAGIVSPPN